VGAVVVVVGGLVVGETVEPEPDPGPDPDAVAPLDAVDSVTVGGASAAATAA